MLLALYDSQVTAALIHCLTAMQMFVKILGRSEEEMMKLDVEAGDSLDCVKAKIQWETLIPPHHQTLIFDGTLLEGSRPISEYNIQQLSQVRVAIKRPDDLSTQVGCCNCHLTISLVTGEYISWLCEACAANAAIAGELDPTDYTGGPPRKRNRTR